MPVSRATSEGWVQETTTNVTRSSAAGWLSESTASSGSLPSVVGTLAATESGSDVAALLGSQAPVAGTLAATESGSDVAALLSSVPAPINLLSRATPSGSWVQETGSNSHASMSGWLQEQSAKTAITGSISLKEAQSDSAGFYAAGITTSGYLAAVEAADTAAISSSAPIRGSIEAAESGGDVAHMDSGNGRPAWRNAMAPYTWATPSTNVLRSLDPEDDPLVNPAFPADALWHGTSGQDGMFSYSGGVWMESLKKLRIWGGGHANYAGNEVYDWDALTGAFSRIKDPTGAIGNEGILDDYQEASGVYFDGQMRSVHSYNLTADRNGEAWAFGGSFYRNTPTIHNLIFRFDTNQWSLQYPKFDNHFGAATYDPKRDAFWIIGTTTTAKFNAYDPVAKTLTAKTAYLNLSGERNMRYVPAHDALVVLVNDTPNPVRVYDCATDTVFMPSITGPSPFVTGDKPGRFGMAVDEARSCIYLWHGGNVITKLAFPTDSLSGVWEWSTLDPAPENTILPPALTTQTSSGGTNGRFWYSPSLDCCGLVNAANEPMYVFSLKDTVNRLAATESPQQDAASLNAKVFVQGVLGVTESANDTAYATSSIGVPTLSSPTVVSVSPTTATPQVAIAW